MTQTDEERKAYQKEYDSKPENKAKRKKLLSTPEYKAKRKVHNKTYSQRPEVKARKKARQSTPEHKAYQKAYSQKPENKARRKEQDSKPKRKAYQKAYQRTPEYKAREKERQSTPEYKARQKTRIYKIRLKVLQYYSKQLSKSDIPCCRCCGENFHIDFLAVDHIAGKKEMDSEHELVKLGYSSLLGGKELVNWIIKNNFPDVFQILCHNCNVAKGYSKNKNKCPHEK